MKHKTSELQGALLDAAVAKAEGKLFELFTGSMCYVDGDDYCPSTDWLLGGPMIGRERIATWMSDEGWCATPFGVQGYSGTGYIDVDKFDGSTGETQLIAACRAYVTAKFGEEVDLPEVSASRTSCSTGS